MAITMLKYSKWKNLNDVNFTFSFFKKNEIESIRSSIFEDLLQSKNSVLSQYNQFEKEYRARIRLEKEIAALSQRQISVSHEATSLQKKLQLLKEEKENDNKKEVHRKVLMFEQNLGLKLIPRNDSPSSKDVAISFVFHNINENNTQETCSFVLSIIDDVMYKAIECNPTIDCMDDLILKLNKTNDIQHFIVSIRKEFCKFFSK